MSRQSYTIVRRTTASPEALYALLADVPSWRRWAPGVSHAELVREGSPDPTGAGAVRRVGGPRPVRIEEEILEAEPGAMQRYTITRGLPVDGYQAVVRFERRGDATVITWEGSFTPKVGVLGPALKVALRSAVSGLARGLVREAERGSAGPAQHGGVRQSPGD